jgi:hypothetical protein
MAPGSLFQATAWRVEKIDKITGRKTMNGSVDKRTFLTAGVGMSMGLGIGLAANKSFAQGMQKKPQQPTGVDDLGRSGANPPKKREIPVRKAKTTKLFLTPPSWPNAIATDPQGRGFWVAEQRHDGQQEAVWLLDWNGKVLHKLMTNAKDTSGMTFGDGCIWSGSVGESIKGHGAVPTEGIFQTDMNSKQVTHRQIPFGPKNNGGACHGLAWQNGKLWVDSNRLECLLRIDPHSWQVDYMFPAARLPDWSGRLHGLEFDADTGFLWQVCGHQNPDVPGYGGYTPGLIKYDVESGEVLERVEFVPGSCDMHDVAISKGQFYGIDAGEHPGWSISVPEYQHPGWPPLNSPSGGYVFKIDMI